MSEPQEPRSHDPSVVEIRIHGVSGTPPTELLNRPITRRVAGDSSAGFYKPALDDQLRDRPRGGTKDRGPWLEGFSWSGLTSGSATRALWILLLPFGLINLAPYAVPGPRPEQSERRARLWDGAVATIGVVSRLIAGTLTAALALGACGIGLLTIGTRCGTTGSYRNCHGIPVWITQRLGAMSDSWAWACGIVVPLTVVCVLLLISRRSDHNESLEPDRDTPLEFDPDAAPQSEQGDSTAKVGIPTPNEKSPFHLGRRDVWTSGRHSIHQRGVHARIALTVTGAVACWPLTEGSHLRSWLIMTICVAASCDLVLLIWGRRAFGDRRPIADRQSVGEFVRGRSWTNLRRPGMLLHVCGWAAVSALGVVTLSAVVSGSPLPADDLLVAWFDGIVIWGFRAQVGLLIVLIPAVGVACWVTVRRKRLFIRGWSSAILAASSVLLGAVLTSAVMIAVPAWLATPGLAVGPSSLADAMNRKSSWYGESIGATGFAVATVTLVLLLVLAGCLLLTTFSVWLPGSAGRDVDRFHVKDAFGLYEQAKGQAPRTNPTSTAGRSLRKPRWQDFDRLSRRRAIDVARVYWWARRVDYVPATVAVVSVICIAALSVVMWLHWLNPSAFPWRTDQGADDGILPRDVIVTTASWGIWLAVAGLVALFVTSLVATRDSSLRRHIGIIWDVASFWPRDTHPLAPPCYSERAIPQLICRINWYTDWNSKNENVKSPNVNESGGQSLGRVILTGHSQGSVIAAAALMKLHPVARERVALLTYGSVLSRLYSRFFPLYFGLDELAKLGESMASGTVTSVEKEDPTGNDRDGAERTRWGNLYRHSDFLGGPILLSLPADADEMRKISRQRLLVMLKEFAPSHKVSWPTQFRLWLGTLQLFRLQVPGPVQLRGIDALQPDPALWAEPGDSVFPAADRHSRYEADVSFQYEISRLVRMFGPGFEEYDPGFADHDRGATRAMIGRSRPAADVAAASVDSK